MAERFGEAFGLKLVPQYEYVEVTTFRSEVYTSKNRKPEVKFVPSLSEDLARRDFTMNAMVLRPDGTIYDPYGGKLDIHSKRIKTVGMPKERINEDPLRMLRAARFAARYGFEIDPNFIGKARQLADRIYDVSVERWVQELDKLITSGHARYGMEQLEAMGLRKLIIPEALPNQWLFDREFNSDMAWSALLWNTGSPYSDNKETAKKISKYINSGICQRLKFSNVRTEIVQNPQRLAFCTDLYNEQIDIILGGS
jgi:tRNA nucleotidyltransferase/poly(A) polymerase